MSLIRRAVALVGVRRYFHQLSLRARVVLSQLPLSVAALFVLLDASFHPALLGDQYFRAGMMLQALLLAACILVPWARLPRPGFWIIPLLDLLSIGLLQAGAGEHVGGISLLAVMPVVWLVGSNVAPITALVVSFVAPLGIAWAGMLVRDQPPTGHALAEPLLLSVMMLGIAVSLLVLTDSLEAQQRTLESKDGELQRALAKATANERLLNAMVDSVGVGLLTVDGAGHDVMMNNIQLSNHRLAVPAEVSDPTEAQLLVFGKDRTTPVPAHQRPVRRAVLGESYSGQLIWLGTGAAQRAFSVSARAMTDDDGAFDGSIVAFSDVTDLVAAIGAKDEFVANVSHELRTPLTSIIGYLELALEEEAELPENVSTALAVSLRNSERLLSLVTDLLTSSGAGVDLRPRDTSLARVIQTSLDSAAPRAAAAGISLVPDVVDPLPAFIDPDRMSQVLDNLLSNAIKYSPDGGIVTVRAYPSGGSVICQVQDTGIGMDPADLKALFRRFFRTDPVRRSAIEGSGLGLSITKAIVEAHGGTVGVESVKGAGSTFTITLPATDTSPSGPGLSRIKLGL